uniref:Branched-chain-amino-acid aminotransferase n=1 Tax=Alexandrium catenella TaxID=2925 RepID=A0A7S1L4P3_ALECA|mmetsp:Transcript_105341/g.280479  ORF Transcript_105341/g.280479 Transcript_105341/m.280479 type:complete len:192 (+) Transcript_105341:3-578(+)
MRIEAFHQRAAPKGVGDVKAAGNYAPCFSAQKEARDEGYSDVVYLDVTGKYIEEAAASNFFALGEDGILRTPSLGTILPGVTRDSIIQIAKRIATRGGGLIRDVQEGDVSLEHVAHAKEAFVTGTGAGITPIAHVTLPGGAAVDMEVPGPATKLIQETLRNIQMELEPDEFGWLWDPFEAIGMLPALRREA